MKSANIALIFPRLFSRQLGMQRVTPFGVTRAPNRRGLRRQGQRARHLGQFSHAQHFRRPCLAVADKGPLPQAPQPQRLQGNAPKTGARKQAQAEYSHVRQVSVKA